MGSNGVTEWSYTRTYDIGDGPWPSEDTAEIECDAENDRIPISGVYHDGSTVWEGCARRVRYNEREDALFVDIGIVSTGEEVALTVAQRIHYEFSAEMMNGFPSRTELRHLTHGDDVQFSITSEYD